jgi:hypothetical protein
MNEKEFDTFITAMRKWQRDNPRSEKWCKKYFTALIEAELQKNIPTKFVK